MWWVETLVARKKLMQYPCPAVGEIRARSFGLLDFNSAEGYSTAEEQESREEGVGVRMEGKEIY